MGKQRRARVADGYVVINFFVPLRRGIRLPTGITFNGTVSAVGGVLVTEEPKIVDSQTPLPPPSNPSGDIRLRLIRADEPDADAAYFDGLYSTVLGALGRQQKDAPPDFAGVFGDVVRTVVQVNVTSPCKLGSDRSTAEAVEEAFGWWLDALRELVFRYRQSTGIDAQVPARENLPFMLWMNRITYRRDGTVFEDPGMGAFMPGGHGVGELEREDISYDQLKDMLSTSWDSYTEAIFQRFNTFALNAREAIFLRGDYGAAILNSATAAECLLDDLLSHALWWEGMTPDEAVPALSKPIYNRVKSEFPGRFGGVWLSARGGAVQAWHNGIARYRDRIIHGGYRPTREEAIRAGEALAGLRKFLGKRVVDRRVRSRYPYLPLLLLGPTKLDQARMAPEPLIQWYQSGSDYGPRFDRWRAITRRLRVQYYSGTVQPELEKCAVFAVVTRERISHYALDAPFALAAEIRIPRLLERERQLLQHVQHNLGDQTYAALPFIDFGVKSRVMVSRDWLPAEQVLPGYEFSKP